MRLIFAFGVSFELPVPMTLLARVGMVSAAGLADKRKYAMVLAFVVAAILTSLRIHGRSTQGQASGPGCLPQVVEQREILRRRQQSARRRPAEGSGTSLPIRPRTGLRDPLGRGPDGLVQGCGPGSWLSPDARIGNPQQIAQVLFGLSQPGSRRRPWQRRQVASQDVRDRSHPLWGKTRPSTEPLGGRLQSCARLGICRCY